VHRTWDVTRHPRWLVFEVEGRLQIRPLQQQIAQTLIDNPGAVVQLNMGEGKTRVILPMLALHWADGQHVVSVWCLPAACPVSKHGPLLHMLGFASKSNLRAGG
jgi:hypothetical protein